MVELDVVGDLLLFVDGCLECDGMSSEMKENILYVIVMGFASSNKGY